MTLNPQIKENFRSFILDLQDDICKKLEEVDGKGIFQEDTWVRDEGGGGITRVMERGDVFEKGGVSTSEVFGELPELIRERFNVNQGWFYATGISLVIHPENPMVPTVHANFRYFELYEKEGGRPVDAWFGGGADLTPYYLQDEDAVHFHKVLKDACDQHGKELYPDFKLKCDEYFYSAHRQEARGIGGIFFDYLREQPGRPISFWLDLVKDLGKSFLTAYIPIVLRRKKGNYTEEQRYFQEIRRGRYVEFNLIHDRGTLFGLKTGGRTESILMSLPPRARWDYNYQIKPGSKEDYTIQVLNNPKNWI
ncbi:MAG: oxygen-dependent coproporphyrinogen oxidase [Balneolales bacterium]